LYEQYVLYWILAATCGHSASNNSNDVSESKIQVRTLFLNVMSWGHQVPEYTILQLMFYNSLPQEFVVFMEEKASGHLSSKDE
jgi:hypothetical protein